MKKVTVNVSMIWPAPGCCTAVYCGVLTVPSPHPAASAHTEAGRGCQLPATRRASGQLDPAAGGQPGYSCSWELQCNSWDSCSILRAGSSCCFTAGCSTTAALERILVQNVKCSILDKYDITNVGPNTTVSTVLTSKSGSKSCQTWPFLFSKYGYQELVCTRTSGWLYPCVNIHMVIAW